MNKTRSLWLVIGGCCWMFSSVLFANWEQDCQSIQSGTKNSGACSAIKDRMESLRPYAPLRPFLQGEIKQSDLDGKFPWSPVKWASEGKDNSEAPLGPEEYNEENSDTGGAWN